jgi:hypothetical protein
MSAEFVIPEWMTPAEPPPQPDTADVDPYRVEALVNRFIAAKQDALFTGRDAYFRHKGSDAVRLLPHITNWLLDLRNEQLARPLPYYPQSSDQLAPESLIRLLTDGERAALGERLDAHIADAMDGINRHVAAQRDVLNRQTLAERQALIQRAAELEHTNDDKLAGLAEANASAARELGRMNGKPEGPAIDAARSAIWKTAIEQRLANGRGPLALTLFDRVKDRLTLDDRLSLDTPLQVARHDQTADQWIAGETATDGPLLKERLDADPNLPPETKYVIRAKLDARDSAAESTRAATVKGLDDQVSDTTRILATTPGTYKPGTLARIADAYDAAGAPDKAASARRLSAQEAALLPFARASAVRQQRMIDELPEGELRDTAIAIQRLQAGAFAKDAFAAGTALYPDVGPPAAIDDVAGRIRQARGIAERRGIAIAPFTGDEIAGRADDIGEQVQTWPQDIRAVLGPLLDTAVEGTGLPQVQVADPNVVLVAGDDKKEKPPRLPGGANRPRFGSDDEMPLPKQINPLAPPGPAGGGFRFPRLQGSSPKGNESTAKPAQPESAPKASAASPVNGAASPNGSPTGEKQTQKAPPPTTNARQGTDPSAVEARVRSLQKPGPPPSHEPQPRAVSSLDEATRRMINEANYAQKDYSPAFGEKGRLKDWSIKDAAGALRLGVLVPKDVYVDFVVRDGHMLIVNTRSSQALLQAGIPRQDWYMRDMTGDLGPSGI